LKNLKSCYLYYNMTEIRPAERKDWETLKVLEKVIFNSEATENVFDTHFEGRHTRNMYSVCYVLVYGPELVGFILIDVAGNRGCIASIGVVDQFRRKGYASNLMRVSEEELKKRGIQIMSLNVKATNEPAIKCYKESGYIVVCTQEGYYRNGADAFYMEKYLFT